ncbi:AraC family transcriptional regulator [Halobacteriovorax sp. GB3]|uniref:helix-turn-helix transcriptional regulator n=1 Tax=Halobacteriovorax sp. GB3 TaxID=2719615 RepID=UPI00235EBFFC|nr:AraC family transcriptional regulator [Halobacteriovorax sp. GB3]MDD0854153.1 AraC family transcriptional regulator [Halobacteriovorax sp. GB3]
MTKILSTEFNTVNFSKEEKIEAYRESISVVYETQDYSVKKDQFEAVIKGYLLGELMLIDCKTYEQLFTRSNSKIAQDGLDHIQIQLFLEGSTNPLEEKTYEACTSKNLIVMDSTRPWVAKNSFFHNLSLIIPRRLLLNKKLNLDHVHGMILNTQENPFAMLLYTHIRTLHASVDKIDSHHAHLIVSPSIDLAVSAMSFKYNSEQGKAIEENENAYVFRIKNYIEENLHDPHLKVESICHFLSLPRTTIYRLFPKNSGGIRNYIQERRMRKSYRLLSNASNSLSISQVSFECGFNSESSFTRAFKNYFGILPKQAQKKIHSDLFLSKQGSDHLWSDWLRNL